jgi:hypothetical protein
MFVAINTIWYKSFENFDGLLLNLYLLLKNSSVKSSIFNEIQQSYDLPSLRVSLTQVSLAHCIRISKFRTLSKNDYKDTLKLWLRADDTKTKKRRVQCRLKK